MILNKNMKLLEKYKPQKFRSKNQIKKDIAKKTIPPSFIDKVSHVFDETISHVRTLDRDP